MGTLSSLSRFTSHMISDAAVATAQYSASVDDLATVRCFLDIHEIGFRPKNMIYADVEVRSTFPPQSASE